MSSQETKHGPASIGAVLELAKVIEWAIRSAPVRWLDADTGELVEGTARSIGTDQAGGFLRGDEDVRDGFLRITTLGGWETFLPVPDAAAKAAAGEMGER